MAKGSFSAAVSVILGHEGGYVDHPADPGGATNMGITHKTLASWLGHPVTKQDVKSMHRETAVSIYRANYWNAMDCDDLPSGVDLSVFDFGVNAGPARAVKMLQRIVGTEQDGNIGPATLSSVRQWGPETLVNEYAKQRMAYYRSLRTWGTFGKGWSRRTEETRQAAASLARMSTASIPAVTPTVIPNPQAEPTGFGAAIARLFASIAAALRLRNAD